MTAPAHCARVNGPTRAGSGRGAGRVRADAPSQTVGVNGSGTLTSCAGALTTEVSAGAASGCASLAATRRASSSEPAFSGNRASALDAAIAATISAVGHGSPPGTRGRPRRTGRAAPSFAANRASSVADAACCGKRDSGAPDAASVTAVAVTPVCAAVSCDCCASSRSACTEVPRSGDGAAGGHGSPPGTRGRPRRTAREAGATVAASVAAATPAGAAVSCDCGASSRSSCAELPLSCEPPAGTDAAAGVAAEGAGAL